MIEVACGNCGEVAGHTNPAENFYGRCPSCSAKVEYVANVSQNRFSAYSLGAPDDPTQKNMVPPPDGTRVMCPSCGRNLLGVWVGGALHIRHKGKEWLAAGVIGVNCHNACGAAIQVDTQRYEVKIVQSLQEILNEVSSVDASDAATRLAAEHGISLLEIEGTGKDGRIIKPDVEALLG